MKEELNTNHGLVVNLCVCVFFSIFFAFLLFARAITDRTVRTAADREYYTVSQRKGNFLMMCTCNSQTVLRRHTHSLFLCTRKKNSNY